MGRPFDHMLRLPGAQPEDVALAIAAEFEPVDPAAAHERLDGLAAGTRPIASLPPDDRAVALVEELAIRRGLACEPRAVPEALLLDRVLTSGRGHPVALAIAYSAVARRLGWSLLAVGSERQVMLADPASAPTIVFDPAGRVRNPPSRIRWLCPHVIGAVMLDGLATAYVERGELRSSIHALELAGLLPLAGPLRGRIDARLTGIRARLN
jgi:hypothetical protein